MAGGSSQRAGDRLGGLHRQVLDSFVHHPFGLVRWQFAADHLELLVDQIGHDLRHLLPAAPAKELLLGRVTVAERHRETEALELGQIAEHRPGADLQGLGQIDRSDPRTRRGGRKDHQQPMQASRPIHVADRSTAYMGLQFDDPPYNRAMSSLAGESRRWRGRLPNGVWLGGGLLLLVAIVFLARQIILPFLLALFLTYLLLPAVNAMTNPGRSGRRTPRGVAAFLALAAFVGVLVVAILVLSPLLAAEANRLARVFFGSGGHEPPIARRLSTTLQGWRNTLYGTGVFPPSLQQQLDQEARDFVSGLGDAAAAAVSASLMFFPRLLELVAVPLLTFYMLLDGPRLTRELRGFLPPAQQNLAGELTRRWDRVLSEYVRGQLIISLFIGVVVTVGLRVMGLKAALLVGTVAFFIEAIPFFGPLIWGTLAVLLALAQTPDGSPLPILVGIFALVAQQVDSHVIAPMILGRFTKVHPLLLIFSTLLGASLFGLIGMFLAAPVTALGKETFLFVMERVQARRGAASLSVPA